MAAISTYAEKAMLDWILGGATPTQPTTRFLGLSTVLGNSTAASELTMAGYTRSTVTFGAANTAGGSAVNAASVQFGPFSTNCSITGINIWDQGAGSMLWFGSLAAARTLTAGDTLIFSSGAITVSLS
jgi:hypothetical protein